MNIRTLRADEIECRVQQVTDKDKAILLLYKDARCDMKILDECFGVLGWEREHQLINGNLFCTVRLWDEERKRWVSKQDVGTESMAEKEKGQASDSFKRACFNIGIGRELYSSPKIDIDAKGDIYANAKGKKALNVWVKFSVSEIAYDDNREIVKLVIVDQNGKERFSYDTKQTYTKPKENKTYAKSKEVETSNKATDIKEDKSHIDLISEDQSKKLFMLAKGIDTNTVKNILSKYKFNSSKEITKEKYNSICTEIEELGAKV